MRRRRAHASRVGTVRKRRTKRATARRIPFPSAVPRIISRITTMYYAAAARWQRLGALGVANPHTHHCSMLVQFFAISLGR